MSDPRQLGLTLDHRPSLTGHDFLVSEGNREAVLWLDRWPDWPASALVVHGPPGCGKSHLVAVFLARSGGRAMTVDELAEAAIHEVVEAASAVAVDDADGVAGADREAALMHLYNACAERGRRLLLTGRDRPGRWGIRLPDLESRLNAAMAAAIGPPDDVLIRAVMVKLFADRQLAVDADVVEYAAARMERSFDTARRLVAAVDDEALRRQGRITVPLVRDVLAGLEAN